MKPTVAGTRGGGGRGAAAAAVEGLMAERSSGERKKKKKRIFDLRSGRMNSPPLLWLLKKILKSSLEEAAGEGRRGRRKVLMEQRWGKVQDI